MAHYINVNLETPAWERLGKDLEEFNIELNAEVEETPNILGETNILISSYAATAEAEPYPREYLYLNISKEESGVYSAKLAIP